MKPEINLGDSDSLYHARYAPKNYLSEESQ